MSKIKNFIMDVCYDKFDGMTEAQIALKYRRYGVSEKDIKSIIKRYYNMVINE